jgi:hypothetical protein
VRLRSSRKSHPLILAAGAVCLACILGGLVILIAWMPFPGRVMMLAILVPAIICSGTFGFVITLAEDCLVAHPGDEDYSENPS